MKLYIPRKAKGKFDYSSEHKYDCPLLPNLNSYQKTLFVSTWPTHASRTVK